MKDVQSMKMMKNLVLLALAVSASTSVLATSNTVETVNLQDLGLNRAVTFPLFSLKPGKTVNGKVPSLGGQAQTNAFGTLATVELGYNLKGQSHRLTGKVGIDDGVAQQFTEGAEVFVYGDFKKLWSSGPLKSGQPPVSMDVDLKGVKQLEIISDFAGDQYAKAHGTYADMVISYSGFCPQTDFVRRPKPDPATVFICPKGPETPRITGGRVFGVRPGSPFLFTVTASGKKPMTYSAKNLPDGLKLDSQTGRITGCLKSKGEHRVLLSARNELGIAERELKIVVGDQIALSPTMGFCSWNAMLKDVSQEKVEKAAELLVSTGLKDHGYLYVNIDDGWQGARGGQENALQANEKFPDMKGLCDKIHSLGLKAGIYHTPWMTSFGKLPGGTAATPDGKWSLEKNGKSFQVGPYSFLNQDARQWGEWGFDYCKWDWVFHKPEEIIAVSKALKQSGRDMICSLSNRAVIEHARTYVEHANSWRTTNDHLSRWVILQTIGFSQNQWADFVGPGHWIDLDQLTVGIAWLGKPTNLTPDEQYLQFSMWCLMSSTFLISCELDKLDEFTLRLLTNGEVLDINQDPLGKPARRTLTRGPLDVWVRDLEDGSKVIGFFNRTREPLNATVDLGKLGITGPQKVRDLWRREDLEDCSGSFSVSPRPHGVVLVRMWPRGNR
jgi:alpha-galactosidase